MSTTKIVINCCYGGFSLSDEAIRMFLNRKNIQFEEHEDRFGVSFNEPGKEDWSLYETIHNVKRFDADLAYVVETLGERANGGYAKLTVEEIPTGTFYRINEYDGFESIETRDQIEWEVA